MEEGLANVNVHPPSPPTSPNPNISAPASPTQSTSEDEEPYALDRPSFSASSITFDQNCEPMKPGDVLLYYTHLYPAGDERGRREATVIDIDPMGKPILTLSNSECLLDDTQVCRIKTLHRNALIDHKGLSSASSPTSSCLGRN